MLADSAPKFRFDAPKFGFPTDEGATPASGTEAWFPRTSDRLAISVCDATAMALSMCEEFEDEPKLVSWPPTRCVCAGSEDPGTFEEAASSELSEGTFAAPPSAGEGLRVCRGGEVGAGTGVGAGSGEGSGRGTGRGSGALTSPSSTTTSTGRGSGPINAGAIEVAAIEGETPNTMKAAVNAVAEARRVMVIGSVSVPPTPLSPE